jgi:hypothetical protein
LREPAGPSDCARRGHLTARSSSPRARLFLSDSQRYCRLAFEWNRFLSSDLPLSQSLVERTVEQACRSLTWALTWTDPISKHRDEHTLAVTLSEHDVTAFKYTGEK